MSFQLYRGPCSQALVGNFPRSGGGLSRQEFRNGARQVAVLARKSKKAEGFVFGTNELRPWTYKMPTLYDILEDSSWPDQVKDWRVFWGVFSNWQEAWGDLHRATQTDDTQAPKIPLQKLAWLQLDVEDCDKMEEAINIVLERIPDLLVRGAPVPEEIEGKRPWHVGQYELETYIDVRGNVAWRRGVLSGVNPQYQKPEKPDEVPEWPQADNVRPWDNWDANELRAYMEKRRAHRRRQAEFAKSQESLGTRQYLIASAATDYRYAQQAAFYPVDPRDRSHEEYMGAVLMYGKAVDPRTIPVRILNPAEHADAFKEGIHWVDEPIDYAAKLGHVTVNEEDLIGVASDAPSATMDEEFSESEEAGPSVDEVDSEFGEGLDVVTGNYEDFDED